MIFVCKITSTFGEDWEKFMNKSEVIDIINSKGGEALLDGPKKFLKDREIVMHALKNLRFINEQMNWYKPFLSFLPLTMRKDREIVLLAVNKASSNYEYAHKDFRDDKDILLKAINTQRRFLLAWGDCPNNDPIFHASARLQKDTETLGKAIFKSTRAAVFMKDMSMGKQLEIAISCIKCFSSNYFESNKLPTINSTFNVFDHKVKSTVESVCRIGIGQFESLGLNLEKFMQNDKKTLIKFLSNFPEELPNNIFIKKKSANFDEEKKKLLVSLITINPKCYKHIPLRYKKDEIFVIRCLESNPMCLQHLAPKYKSDEFIVLKAIKLNPESFKFAKQSIQKENLLPSIAAIPNLKSNFVLLDLLDADVSSLSLIEKNKIFKFFINRTDEKDIFILAKAKKRFFQ